MHFSVTGRTVYTGTEWLSGARVDVTDGQISAVTLCQASRAHAPMFDMIAPGLVDSGAVVSGYTDRRNVADPFAPERACSLMYLRHGVTDVIEMGSPYQYLPRGGLGRHPRVWFSGGRLTRTATRRTDIKVTPHDVSRTVTGLRALGANFISACPGTDWSLAVSIAASADEAGLPIAWSPTVKGVDVPGWIWSDGRSLPEKVAFSGDLRGYCCLAPCLEGTRAWTIDGLVETPSAWMAAPVWPHARHFRTADGRMEKRMARAILGNIFPERDPTLINDDRDTLTDRALRARRCLAASSTGEAGLVPGLSLWRELRLLSDVCQDAELALHASTGACRRLGIAAGTIVQGADANFICWDKPQPQGELPALDGLSDVFVAGEHYKVDDLQSEVDDLITIALERREN